MDGLINYGIVRPELAGAFGAGVRAQQDERMQNQLTQQKLAMGQMQQSMGQIQQEQASLQLQDFKRRQSALDQFVTKAQQTGRTGTPKELAQQFYDYAITAKEPQVIMAAQQALLAADEREKYLSERTGPAPIGAAPAMPTGALGSGTFGIMPETTNALAPKAAPAPSVNAMVDPATAIRNEIVRLDMTYPGGAAKREIGMLETQLKELEKRYVVPNVGMVTGGGRTIVEAGIAPTDIKKLISERDKLPAGDPNRKVYDQAIADIGAQARIAQQRLAFDQNKFAWEKANPGFELKEGEDGTFYGVNKRTLQAFPVNVGGAAPATGGAQIPALATQTPAGAPMAGTPLRGKGTALTESQGNATAYGMRMKEANAILEPLEKAGKTDTGLIKGVFGGAVGLVPFIGDKLEDASGSIFNALPQILGGLSPEQQQVAQARINFITAILRKESGAAIGKDEFATAEKNYFPKPGDNDATIAQKQKARKTAIRAMEIQAGPGAKQMGNDNDPLGLGIK